MTANRTVRLQITSECDGQQSQQHFTAELYLKGRHAYIRYHETDPNMGRTLTTLKLEANAKGVNGTLHGVDHSSVNEAEHATDPNPELESEQIRIFRHGDIQSEQTFIANKAGNGFYQTPQGKLTLETFTHSIASYLNDAWLGKVSWSYDLFVSGELSGSFHLCVEISEFE